MLKRLICCVTAFVMLSSIFLATNVFGEKDLKDFSSVTYGDLNQDGVVNSTDYILLRRYVLGVIDEFPSEIAEIAADLNGDGVINSTDCVLLRRYILNMIDRFPVEENNEIIDEGISEGFISGNRQFAFDIFKHISNEDHDKNIFISPFNISVALSMVNQGAGSETKDQLKRTLGFEGLRDSEVNQSYKYLLNYLNQFDQKIKINNSNSIWNNTLWIDRINENFISVNQDIFNAWVALRDFSDEDGVLDEINNWISEATEGLIEKLLSSIDEEDITYILTAIYFKGMWEEEFKVENTIETDFYMDDGNSKKVMMMKKTGSMDFVEGDGYKAVRVPYGNGEVAMYCILPDEGTSINDFIGDIDVAKWSEIKNRMRKQRVSLELPRFEIEYGGKDLKDSLVALGVEKAFNEYDADFPEFSVDGAHISSVVHKAVVKVNEEGTVAAGYTVIGVSPPGFIETDEFVANRPFMFVIADEKYDTILFMGKYSN
ncbi:UNVERIFIED_CONTAM: serpin B [Acetivibrio alkalicellulosi]